MQGCRGNSQKEATMTVTELILVLELLDNKEIQVNVPQLRAGDEGPQKIKSVEYWDNGDMYLIEVD